MRFSNKYKIFNQSENSFESFHSRIANFKRTKWQKVQKNNSRILLTKKKFINNFCIKNKYKSWDKVKNYYKVGIKIKRSLYSLFDKSIRSKDLAYSLLGKQKSDFRKTFINSLLKPEYRLDILLWRLNFFNSSYQSRQSIANRLVLVNGKFVSGNLFLKAEDIITFSDVFNLNILNLKKNNKIFSFSKSIPFFVEVDYYTNTIILTKELFNLYSNEISLFKFSYYDLKKAKDFFS
jgi:ribosomal protein S4